MKVFVNISNGAINNRIYFSNDITISNVLYYGMESKLDICDFLLAPSDYFSLIRGLDLAVLTATKSGRNKEGFPYFIIVGIKFQMISNEDADKYRLLQ